jgi:3-phenylpropionate/cinnamic acid dioxygenase small subunit
LARRIEIEVNMGVDDSNDRRPYSDRESIVELLAAYCHALDERRFEVMIELFTDDATLTTRIERSVYRGKTAIVEYLQNRPENMRGLHMTVNPEIVVSGTEAHVRSDFVVHAAGTSETRVVAWGWYRDHVTLEQGAWKFRERQVQTQWRVSDNGALENETNAGAAEPLTLDHGKSVGERRSSPGDLMRTALSIERLSDELEIRNLVAHVAHYADMSESLEDYLACFSEGAVWQFGGNLHEGLSPVRVEGREAIKVDRLARRLRGVQGPGTPNRHLITTLAVDVSDDDTARADSYFLLMTDTTGIPRIRNIGHYHDSFVRTKEGWKLAFRQITTG